MIDLCASRFDGVAYQRTKGAVKVHLRLDHQGYLPQLMVITSGKTHDIEVARRLRFQPGTGVIAGGNAPRILAPNRVRS